MNKEHHLFVVPGLGDKTGLLKAAVGHYPRRYELIPHVEAFGFMDPHRRLDEQLDRFGRKVIPYLERENTTVSFLATSAGASAVLNAYYWLLNRGYQLNGGIVNICGRVRSGREESV